MLTKQESLIWNLLGELASCCAEECRTSKIANAKALKQVTVT